MTGARRLEEALRELDAPPEPPPRAKGFPIREFRIQGSTIYTPEELNATLRQFIGPNRTVEDVEEARGYLQREFERVGYPTMIVTIPEQTIRDGVIRFEIVEASVGKITVTGNKHYDEEWLLGYFPDVKAGKPLYQPDLAKALDKVNQNPDHQVSPVLKPGAAPGTTDLELKVKDRSPWHGRFELNDLGEPNSPALRTLAFLQHANLWGREHVLTAFWQTAPEDIEEVRAYGGAYSIPLRSWGHTLTLYGSFSDSRTAFSLGGTSGAAGFGSFGKGTVLGARYVFPLPDLARWSHKMSVGVDYKDLEQSLEADSTQTAAGKRCIKTNPDGTPVNPRHADQVLPPGAEPDDHPDLLLPCDHPDVPKAAATTSGGDDIAIFTPVRYLPFNVGYEGFAADRWGFTNVFARLNVNFAGTLPRRNFSIDFENRRANATGNYAYATFGISRTQKLWKDWTLYAILDGQRSSSPLIDSEEYAAGGVGTVRGFPERIVLGDDALHSTTELRTPSVGKFFPDNVKMRIQALAFYDMASVHSQQVTSGTRDLVNLASIGLGLRISLWENHLQAKLDYGIPLQGTDLIEDWNDGGNGEGHFSVFWQF